MFFCIANVLLAAPVNADPAPAPATPSAAIFEVATGVTLQASFAQKTRYAIFDPGEAIPLWAQVTGWRQRSDTLTWDVRNWLGATVDSGSLTVPMGTDLWQGALPIKSYGAGYFEVHMSLKNADVTLLRAGSRPGGFVSYGVLPDVERVPLAWNDDARFGGQGTNFLESGKLMVGNPFRPLYPALGMKWAYDGYRMAERESKAAGTFKPITDPAEWSKKNDYDAAAGMTPLIDMHGIPEWLVAFPAGQTHSGYALTSTGQSYAPNDWTVYANYIRNVAAEQVARRKALFPKQQHSYYQIHWEPDWHWKGEDSDFIKMYEVAHRAVHEGDPDAVLLGPNYGVMSTGNTHLARLFAKGLGQHLDGIATHSYYIPFGMPEDHDLPAQVRELVAMTRKYLKPGAKIINTEWGTDYHGDTILRAHDLLRGEMAEFMRGHLICLGEGIDCTWYFYTADIGIEGGGGLVYNLTTPNPMYGAVAVSPKPVAMSGAAATRLLDGTKSLGRISFLGDNVLAYLFDRNGERIAVLWSKDGVSRDVAVPVGAADAVRYDAMGNATRVATVDGVARIKVDDVPSYLRGLSPALYSSSTIAGTEIPSALPGGSLTLPKNLQGAPLVAFRNGQTTPLTSSGSILSIPQSMQAGSWLLKTGPSLAQAGAGQPIEIEAPVSITRDAASGSGLRVLLRNATPKLLQGSVSLSGNGRTIAVKPVALPARASVPFGIDPAIVAKLGPVESVAVEFVDSFGVVSKSEPIRALSTKAALALKPVSMDGTLNDWQLEQFSTFDTRNDVSIGSGAWTGVADLSFRAGFRYDAANLYIGLKVRDDSHVQEFNGGDIWRQDSVQIGIGTVPGTSGWKYTQKLAVALRSKDNAVVVSREAHTSTLPSGPVAAIRANVVRGAGETYYILAIPWNQIVPNESGIPTAKKIAVGILVNDVDRQGKGTTDRKAMEAFGDGMGFFLPDRFAVVYLN
ncbi:MAG TPA: sugar-binding protein [Capsulimonadaceae bacterium]